MRVARSLLNVGQAPAVTNAGTPPTRPAMKSVLATVVPLLLTASMMVVPTVGAQRSDGRHGRGGRAAPAAEAHADRDGIVVAVSRLRSDDGVVRGALFGSPSGWTERGREVATCRGTIRNGRARCVFRDVPPGTYAFAFVHDENGNGDMDRNAIGIPEEGFGFTNDAPTGLGPPSFESASFAYDGAAATLPVHARYGI